VDYVIEFKCILHDLPLRSQLSSRRLRWY